MSAILLSCLLAGQPQPSEYAERLLAAIAIVESADKEHPAGNPGAIGKAGERSMYQIMPAIWAAYTQEPFEKATSDPALAKRIAHLHLASLKLRGVPNTPYSLALAWKVGETKFRKGAITDRDMDYARRVRTIFEEMSRGK